MQMDSRDRRERLTRLKVNVYTDFEPEEVYEDEIVHFRDLKLGSMTPIVRRKANSS